MLYRAYLLDALIRMKAESEAIRLIEEQAAGIGEIRSSRTAAVLNNAIGGVDTEKGSPALREASHQLRDRLALAGYPA
jgi:hypothetical protein